MTKQNWATSTGDAWQLQRTEASSGIEVTEIRTSHFVFVNEGLKLLVWNERQAEQFLASSGTASYSSVGSNERKTRRSLAWCSCALAILRLALNRRENLLAKLLGPNWQGIVSEMHEETR